MSKKNKEINQLDSIVFRYYPDRVHYYNESEKFIRTAEYLRLARLTNSFHSTQKYWQDKINEMNSNLGVRFYPVMPNWLDRCLVFQMELDSHGRGAREILNLDISCFEHFFSLFNLIQTGDCEYKRLSSPTNSKNNELLKLVDHYLKKEFNMIEFPKQLLKEIIPSISFESEFGQFTYYNAFFTNTPMIV